MGYFANGSEGDAYEARYCIRCANQDDDGCCPVMDVHTLYNYEQLDDDSRGDALSLVLGTLIPRTECFNAECKMFRATNPLEELCNSTT